MFLCILALFAYCAFFVGLAKFFRLLHSNICSYTLSKGRLRVNKLRWKLISLKRHSYLLQGIRDSPNSELLFGVWKRSAAEGFWWLSIYISFRVGIHFGCRVLLCGLIYFQTALFKAQQTTRWLAVFGAWRSLWCGGLGGYSLQGCDKDLMTN